MAPNRNPQDVQAWLIGGGVASLAAAVHLVKQAKVPPHQVHILDTHHGPGGALKTSGNSRDGYILHTGTQPYLHGECVKDLLTMIPSPENPAKTSWEAIKEHEWHTRPINKARTRVIRKSGEGPRKIDMHQLRIGAKLRMDLIKFLLSGESSFESMKISEIFDETFFDSELWTLWSTTLALAFSLLAFLPRTDPLPDSCSNGGIAHVNFIGFSPNTFPKFIPSMMYES
jgi:oleate hydratase